MRGWTGQSRTSWQDRRRVGRSCHLQTQLISRAHCALDKAGQIYKGLRLLVGDLDQEFGKLISLVAAGLQISAAVEPCLQALYRAGFVMSDVKPLWTVKRHFQHT